MRRASALLSLFVGLCRIVGLGLAFGPALALGLLRGVFGVLFLRPAQGGAKDVAERSAGIGRAVLGDGLFLLGDFQCLDRHRNFASLSVDLGHHSVELLPDAEALSSLLGAVAREIGAADAACQVVVE